MSERKDRLQGIGAVADTSLGEWYNIGPVNHGGKVYDVAVHPTNPDVVFVASGIGGLWRTIDGGGSWTLVSDRYRNNAIGSVRICPSNPQIVIAGLGTPYGLNAYKLDDGVLKSTDGGNTWAVVGPSVSADESVTQVEFSINDPNTFYAASETGLYRTTNGGTSWSTILSLGGQHSWDWMPSLALHPTDPNTALVAAKEVGIMRTSNGGTSWTRVDQTMDQTNPISVLAWSKSNPAVVYCERLGSVGPQGLWSVGQQMFTYRSSDGGLTWTPGVVMNDFQQGRYDMSVAVDPTNENRVLTANSYMAETLDGFSTYHLISAGHGDYLNITFAPSNPQIVYNGNDGGTWKSTQAGQSGTWARADVGVQTNLSFGFAVDPQSGKIYLSAGDYAGIPYWPGNGWGDMGGGWEWSKFYINPRDFTDVYNSGTGGILRVGAWQDISPDPGGPRPYFNPMVFDPMDSDTIYSATDRLYRSTNRGTTWTLLGPPASQLPVDVAYVSYIAVAPSAPQIIFVHFELDGHLWKTTDGGGTWTGLLGPAYGIQFSHALTVMSDNPNELFVGTGTGLYHSLDGGVSATPVTGGLPTVWVKAIVVDPAFPNRLFLATTTSVFVSQDRGNTWAQLGTALPPVGVNDLELVNGKLYASTYQAIWELDLPATPPQAAALVSPPDGAAGYSSNPTVRWEWAYGASSYDIYFGTSSSPPLSGTTTGTSYIPPTPGANTSCYWRVIAKNSSGTTASPIWSFTTGTPPTAPNLEYPSNGATGIPLDLALTWASVNGATSYDVYFGTSNPPPLVANGTRTYYVVSAPATNTTYYWRVAAKNGAGGSLSAIWPFSTQTAPGSGSGLRLAVVANRGSNNLSVFRWNTTAGSATAVQGSPFAAGIAAPNALAIDSIHGFVYVVPFGGGSLAAFAIDRSTGGLTAVPDTPFAMLGGIAVTVDPGGRFVYVANAGVDGVSAFTINASSGALTMVPGSPFAAGSIPHSLIADPSGRFVYVANCGVGQGCGGTGPGSISGYRIDGTTGALTPVTGSPFAAGTSPSSVMVEPTGAFAYATNAGSGNVSAFAIAPSSGTLTPVFGSPFQAGTQPAAIAFDPAGRFGYVANAGSSNISGFTINSESGALGPIATVATGNVPVSLATDPTGQFLYIANAGSNVTSYGINGITGVLTSIEGIVVGTTPVSIATASIAGQLPVNPLFLPVVLDNVVGVGGSQYTTELTLASKATTPIQVSLLYTASVGTGTGSVSITLAPGETRIIPDALSFLRSQGLAIPTSGNVIGTLQATFASSSSDPFIGGRTFTTGGGGTFGLFYATATTTTTTATLVGLQENAAQRSNVAVINAGGTPVTLRVQLFGPLGEDLGTLPDQSLPAYGWTQINRPLQGIASSGRAVVTEVFGSSPFTAYGVLNDAVTSDGSFIPPLITSGSGPGDRLVPIVLDVQGLGGSHYTTELTLANLTASPLPVTLVYTASLGTGSGQASLTLAPGEQQIVPDAIGFLRSQGLAIPNDGSSVGGSLLALPPSGTAPSGFAVGARTFTPAPSGGGSFGLYYPGLTLGELATSVAFINGLQQNSAQRSNLALVNRGDASDSITLTLSYFDATGAALGTPTTVMLAPGQWTQFGQPLQAFGATSGYAKIEKTSGASRFVAYGVLNDAVTSDGSYIPMSW